MLSKYFNLQKNDYIGQRLDAVFPPHVKAMADVAIRENEQVLHSGTAQHFTNILLPSQNYKLTLLTVKAPYYDEDGKIAGIFGISHHISIVSVASAKNLKFSNRETECLKLLLKGQTMREMGALLNISLKTVGTYIERLKAKLNCSTRSQLISKVLELEIF